MKFISIRSHGILDYVTVIAFALIPTVFGLVGIPAYLSYTLALVHFTMTLLTHFPAGILKIIPIKFHKIVETIVGPVLIIAPWLLDFSGNFTARYVFIGSGMVISIVGLLTNYSQTRARAG